MLQNSKLLIKKPVNIFLRKLVFVLKQTLPQSFLTRSLLIVGFTLLIIQVLIIIIFYDSHWRRIRGLLYTNMAKDIAYITYMVSQNNTIEEMNNTLANNTRYLDIYPNPIILDVPPTEQKSLNAGLINLKERISTFTNNQVYIEEYNSNYTIVKLIIHIKENIYLSLYLDKELFVIFSIKYIILFIITSYIIILLIILQFFRLQLRPLKQLTNAARKFGKGEKVSYITPSGSLEIRQSIKTFNEMREQVENFIEQRTMLLSSVSHDLKTSLTKMNLMLDLTPTELSKELKEETSNMQEIIVSYLNFAKSEYYQNDKTAINIKNFFNKIVNSYKQSLPITVEYNQSPSKITANLQSLTRAIVNIIENNKKYATLVKITIYDHSNHNIGITIEDNGVGIDESEYENVFKPFYKTNQARTAEKGSVGLGLYIVKDIITKHGGNITLEKSSLGGLLVKVILPF